MGFMFYYFIRDLFGNKKKIDYNSLKYLFNLK